MRQKLHTLQTNKNYSNIYDDINNNSMNNNDNNYNNNNDYNDDERILRNCTHSVHL